MSSLLWFVCGALLGFGVVGFFTGLLLVPFGRAGAGWWLARVGAGTGPGRLLLGRLVGYPEARCKVMAPSR